MFYFFTGLPIIFPVILWYFWNWKELKFPGLLFAFPWMLNLALFFVVQYECSISHNSTADYAIAAVCFGFGGFILVIYNVLGIMVNTWGFWKQPEARNIARGFLLGHGACLLITVFLSWRGIIKPFLRISLGWTFLGD